MATKAKPISAPVFARLKVLSNWVLSILSNWIRADHPGSKARGRTPRVDAVVVPRCRFQKRILGISNLHSTSHESIVAHALTAIFLRDGKREHFPLMLKLAALVPAAVVKTTASLHRLKRQGH